MQFNLISLSTTVGIFEGTKIVGSLAAKDDLIPALESSLKFISKIGSKKLYDHADKLNEEIIKYTSEMGFESIKKEFRAKHYLGLRFKNQIPENFVENLAKENVFISARGKKAIRVTPHIWNNSNDIEKFINALRKIM